MKILKILLLSCFAFLWAASMSAQCTTAPLGPYGTGTVSTYNTVQVDISNGCNWSGEAASMVGIVTGNTYTLSQGAGNVPSHYVTVFDETGTAVPSAVGTLDGTSTVTFTAASSGTYTANIFNDATCTVEQAGCRVTLVECTSCPAPPCPDGICQADYCTCDADCPCPTLDISYIDYSAGTPAISQTGGFAYCAAEAFIPIATNPSPEKIYIPLGISTTLVCISAYDVATSHGVLTQNDGTTLIPITEIGDFSVFWVEMTQADLDASGGTVTITVTDVTNGPGGCNGTLAINVPTLSGFTTDVATTCPAAGCTPPAATVVYDCATSSIIVDVTDAGTATTGSTFTITPSAGTPQDITGVAMYSFPLPYQDSTYSIVISDGNAACDLQATAIYPACQTLMAGCNELLADGNLDAATGWTEVADTNSVTIVPAGNIGASTTTSLAGTGRAWLGGWGSATRTSVTSISQTVTIPTGSTATLTFWGLLGVCDSPNDIASVLIDNTSTVWSINGGDAQCGTGTWIKYTVVIPAIYADGLPHTITMQLTEAGTNGGGTNFFVDEASLEECGATSCLPVETVSGTVTADVSAQNLVTTNGVTTVPAPGPVTFDASQCIELNAEFEVMAGAEFNAIIAGCTPFTGESESLYKRAIKASKYLAVQMKKVSSIDDKVKTFSKEGKSAKVKNRLRASKVK